MAIRYRTPHYTALIDGAFDESGVWFIEVAVVLNPPSDPEAREALVRDAKRVILLGVIEETRRGRSLGARTVRVRENPLVRRARQPEALDL